MPLTLPRADSRSFESLVTDARMRLPRLAPGWTDHNVHDPGITLIELFAQLVEGDLYWLSRITAAQRRAFLRWFALEARGPSAARTIVTLGLDAAATNTVAVAEDLEIAPAANDLTFCTTTAVTLQLAGMTAILTGDRRLFAATPAARATVARLDAAAAAFGPAGRDPLVIAFDRPLSGKVSLYFWTGASDHDEQRRRRIEEESAARVADRARVRPQCPESRLDDWRRHPDVDLAWEVYTADGWQAVTVRTDETRALTISGFVQLDIATAMSFTLIAGATAFALRARVERGRFETPPSLAAVLLNAVEVEHRSAAFTLTLGTSNGRAGQTFAITRLPQAPNPDPKAPLPPIPAPGFPLLLSHSKLWVTPDGATDADEFELLLDWDRAASDAKAAVLDPEAPELRFGNGRAGKVPPAGALIEFTSRVGGGPLGNVPELTLVRVRSASHRVTQPFPARGGAPSPSLADLQARLLAELARPTRAVTLTDCEQLALWTPGVDVKRARAIADLHPAFPGLVARGCITVVVVPNASGPRPEPSDGLLAAVRAYLERRRPLTTELHVIGPSYRELAVRARLHLEASAVADRVLAEARSRIDAWLHPLTGGPDGNGWPVGRDVYRSEALALLQDVPGVHHVDALALLLGKDHAPVCGDAQVCPGDLIAALPHDLTIAPERIR